MFLYFARVDFFEKSFRVPKDCAEDLIIYFKLTADYVTTSRPR